MKIESEVRLICSQETWRLMAGVISRDNYHTDYSARHEVIKPAAFMVPFYTDVERSLREIL